MASENTFQRHGLYYPFFHVRDDRWLKVSMLYWPRIARLVPERYRTRDSVTAQAFSAADNQFFYRISPGNSVEEVEARFSEILEGYGRELARRYGRDDWTEHLPYTYDPPDGWDWDWRYRSRDDFLTRSLRWSQAGAGVHLSHISRDLTWKLIEMGLAVYPFGPRSYFEASWGEPLRHELLPSWERLPKEYQDGTWDWVCMPAELVVVYNSLLVEAVSAANGLQPTTDLPDAYAMVNNWTAEGIVAALLGGPGRKSRGVAGELAETLALLAINAVVPANLDQVPAEKIIKIRERYGAEFRAFGLAVDQAAADLTELADIRDPQVLERYLRDEVASRFIQPTKNLSRQLRGLRLDAATMTVNVKTALPAAAGLIGGAALAGHPLIAGTAAAALGLLTVRRGIRLQRDASLQAAPTASYLLHIEGQLGAHGMVDGAIRRFQRIAGTDPG